MKTTFKRVQQFVGAANDYLKKFPEETKLKYAIQKVGTRVEAVNQEYDEAKEDIELEHANVDANGSVLYKIVNGRRQYDFTAEGIKKLRKALNQLFEEPDRFEIKAHMIAELPDDFPEEYRPFFEGFVIPASEKV